MSQLGWFPRLARRTAFTISFVLLSRVLAILLVCVSLCESLASPAAVRVAKDSAAPRHRQDHKSDFHDLANHNIHSHNNAAESIGQLTLSKRVSSTASALPSVAPIPDDPIGGLALDTSFAGSLVRSRSMNEWTVEDFILVSTIDGSLHALDRQTGLEVWSIPGDLSLVQVSTSESLQNATKSRLAGSTCADCDLIWITEPLGDGTLFYFTPDKGLQQLPLSIKELVQSPYAFGKDQKLITGSHQTTLYSIEAKSGRLLKVYGSESTLSQAACPTNRNPFFSEEDYEEDEFIDNRSFMVGRTGRYFLCVCYFIPN